MSRISELERQREEYLKLYERRKIKEHSSEVRALYQSAISNYGRGYSNLKRVHKTYIRDVLRCLEYKGVACYAIEYLGTPYHDVIFGDKPDETHINFTNQGWTYTLRRYAAGHITVYSCCYGEPREPLMARSVSYRVHHSLRMEKGRDCP